LLNLLPTQPPEAPAQYAAMAALARFRTRLENCPNDKRGDWHEAATTAWTAMLQIEQMVSQLIDIRFKAAGSTSHEAIDVAIEYLVDAAATLTSEAERRAEDDAVNGAFYRAIDNWNMRRGGAQ
jgi:hypothetical protein